MWGRGGAVGGKDRVLEVSTCFTQAVTHSYTHTHARRLPRAALFWAIADLDSESTVNKSEA